MLLVFLHQRLFVLNRNLIVEKTAEHLEDLRLAALPFNEVKQAE